MASGGPTCDTSDSFDWRISVARVQQDGPFSFFRGVDRTIALLDGTGFSLRRSPGAASDLLVEIDQVGACFSFHGDDAWTCTLRAGEVLDLNLMTSRKRARGQLTHTFVGGAGGSEAQSVTAPNATHAFFLALEGRKNWQANGQRLAVAKFDAILCTPADVVAFGSEPTQVMRIDIFGNRS